MKILYLGSENGTCLDRADAYRRLGHEVTHIDLRRMLPSTPWVDRVVWHLGGSMLAIPLARLLRNRLRGQTFDLCHVDNGEYVTPDLLKCVRECCSAVVCYCIDDPFGPRDGRRFSALRAAVPGYDMVVVVRTPNVQEALALGARHAFLVLRTADEISHAPVTMSSSELKTWGSEVLFIGTWMPERGPFIADLLRRGVPLAIRGSNWQKAPEWPLLAEVFRGPAVTGADYARAIQGAKVTLGLLSKGNRDLHTTRSAEVPALGGLLCAERTSEHLSMYRDGQEAVFWSDAEDCARQCLALLRDPSRREAIAAAGQVRAHASGYHNQPMLASVLVELSSAKARVPRRC